jgi:hypothetical protein
MAGDVPMRLNESWCYIVAGDQVKYKSGQALDLDIGIARVDVLRKL